MNEPNQPLREIPLHALHAGHGARFGAFAGFRMPIRVGAYPGAWASIPMLFNAGFEYNVIPNLNIHANVEFGPVVVTGGGGGAWVGGHGGFQFGISYLF